MRTNCLDISVSSLCGQHLCLFVTTFPYFRPEPHRPSYPCATCSWRLYSLPGLASGYWNILPVIALFSCRFFQSSVIQVGDVDLSANIYMSPAGGVYQVVTDISLGLGDWCFSGRFHHNQGINTVT